jgi:hypothetical protein
MRRLGADDDRPRLRRSSIGSRWCTSTGGRTPVLLGRQAPGCNRRVCSGSRDRCTLRQDCKWRLSSIPRITRCRKSLKIRVKLRGWDVGIRTPITASRARCPTVERRPSRGKTRQAGNPDYTGPSTGRATYQDRLKADVVTRCRGCARDTTTPQSDRGARRHRSCGSDRRSAACADRTRSSPR